MPQGDIFEHDLLLIPVHIAVHWTLIVVNLRDRRFEYYDALHGDLDKSFVEVGIQ